jgi:diphosphomevalonate decarboxylase
MKSSAVANANIALVKYWGKRDSKLILPTNSSISMTCDSLTTTTTVEFSDNYDKDTILLNDEELAKDEKGVYAHLDKIRKLAGIKQNAKVISESNFPVAAGLASSASGLAALTLAATRATGLELSEKELTILARQGSGSASRSITEGFAEWYKGEKEDGSDSFARTIAPKNYWEEFRMIVTLVKESKKKVSSRTGMTQTIETSPYYQGWLDEIDEDLKKMREGIKNKALTTVGSVAEYNSLKMHCTMMTTKPPIMYWIPATVEIMNAVQTWREEGLESYFTIDAGPNVKILCLEKDVEKVKEKIESLDGVIKTIVCKPGDAAKTIEKHLF